MNQETVQTEEIPMRRSLVIRALRQAAQEAKEISGEGNRERNQARRANEPQAKRTRRNLLKARRRSKQ